MRSITVRKNEEGQRLDRILVRLLPNAGKGFIFKMLRKKNIVLNGKKAEGSERLELGDEIKMFFSEESFAKLTGKETCPDNVNDVHNKLLDKITDMIVY